jgi:hypothetical protein
MLWPWHHHRHQIISFTLHQIKFHHRKDNLDMITGTVVGTSSLFQESPVPGSNFVPLQSGPVFTVDDPLVTLSASPDGDTSKIVAAVAANDTGASYNITVTGVNGAGTTITHTFNVPILPTPPPPPTQITDFSLNQLS